MCTQRAREASVAARAGSMGATRARLLAILLPLACAASAPLEAAERAWLVDEVADAGACGSVAVVQHAAAEHGVSMRFLGCNGTSIGVSYVRPEHARRQLVYTAMIVQAAAAEAALARASERAAAGAPRRVLCLGLGAGAVPTALRERYGLRVDVVERSAAVVRMAAAHFGYAAETGRHGATLLADAATLLPGAAAAGALRGPYDVVVADLFDGSGAEGGAAADGGGFPLAELKARWLPASGGGFLVLNVVAAIGPHAGAMGAPAERAAAELARAFGHVAAFADHAPTAAEGGAGGEGGAVQACNVIFVAADRPLRFHTPAEEGGEEGGEAWVRRAFHTRWELPRLGSAAGWALRVPPSAARAREGALLAAESMAAVQAASLPRGVHALFTRSPRAAPARGADGGDGSSASRARGGTCAP